MEKILRGILKYKANAQGNFLVRWANKAEKLPVKPPILFVSCIDSRILPTHFCQTSPGDMFILRNAGNVLPRANYSEGEPTQLSCEVVALEITCNRSKVEHVVICGHSDCQALYAAYKHYTEEEETSAPLKRVSEIIHGWCRTHGVEASLNKVQDTSNRTSKGAAFKFNIGSTPQEVFIDPKNEMALLDKLSQVNVLQQLEHLSSYRSISKRVDSGQLSVHGMWYDVSEDKIYWFSRQRKGFIEICADTIEEIIASCKRTVRPEEEQGDLGFKKPESVGTAIE
ncbi:beta carbonic anhydrase 1-like [Asterias rubens]|uniref:beta carbonic anhydrase 1-like n=1 Tax=Asterias rubens TaxID=7604 RepID=UPI001454F547|nr:beta carbonic anhydrase 1-like [Asterias rubens]XP_033638320.1 beta carbonic anhydrase 1-like [Asterias rubens]